MTAMLDAFRRMLMPLSNRISLMVGRAVLKVVNDGGGLQRLQVVVMNDELHDNVERFQNYGLSSVPAGGSQALIVAIGGSRSHLVAVAVDDQDSRPKNLKGGEVMLYDRLGNYVHFKDDGTFEMKAVTAGKIIAPEGLLIDAPWMRCTGDIQDKITSGGKTMSQMRGIFDGHDHKENGPPANTNVPNQLMDG
ncbi:phage baseplate assembly protein V [Ferrovibrio terrae]|uniref:phage baseplate assembly protein V n=1 Tax=Ferrovibrio terrae TaxID=2594003 RepID=UPI003137F228